MKFLPLSIATLLLAFSAGAASPDYKSFRGIGGIAVTTNPPTGTVVIDGSGIAGGPSTNYPPYTVPITGTNFVVDWRALGPTNTVIITNFGLHGLIQTNIVNTKERLVMLLRAGSQGFCRIVTNGQDNQRMTQVHTGISRSTNGGYTDLIVWVPDGNGNAILSGQNWGARP